jgi:hypothetical protein
VTPFKMGVTGEAGGGGGGDPAWCTT